MQFFRWDERYIIGIKAMDAQHKRWIAIINELFATLSEGQSKQVLSNLVNETIDYTAFHFYKEEKFLRSIHCPDLDRQKECYSFILTKLEELQEQIDRGNTTISLHLSHDLKTWLQIHILDYDKKYAEYYHTNKSDFSDNIPL